jgi:hypothetical protein
MEMAEKQYLFELPTKKLSGEPPFIPTPEQKALVLEAIGNGLSHEEVAGMILNPTYNHPITAKTLRKHFKDELATAHTIRNNAVASSLYQKAIGDSSQAVQAAMFWLKCRAGWKETSKLELDINGSKSIQEMSTQELKALLAEHLKANSIDITPQDQDDDSQSAISHALPDNGQPPIDIDCHPSSHHA